MKKYNYYGLFYYDSQELSDFGRITFFDTIFIKDFGDIKAGDNFTFIDINFENLEMLCWKDEPITKIIQQLTLIPRKKPVYTQEQDSDENDWIDPCWFMN